MLNLVMPYRVAQSPQSPSIGNLAFNTFAATDVLTRPSLKLFITPGTFKDVLCIYDYIVISAFDLTLFFIIIGLVENL